MSVISNSKLQHVPWFCERSGRPTTTLRHTFAHKTQSANTWWKLDEVADAKTTRQSDELVCSNLLTIANVLCVRYCSWIKGRKGHRQSDKTIIFLFGRLSAGVGTCYRSPHVASSFNVTSGQRAAVLRLTTGAVPVGLFGRVESRPLLRVSARPVTAVWTLDTGDLRYSVRKRRDDRVTLD